MIVFRLKNQPTRSEFVLTPRVLARVINPTSEENAPKLKLSSSLNIPLYSL